MHPIERLRRVARSSGDETATLVRSAATALAGFGGDPAAMVTACRRLVERQPAVGPMWWLAARVLFADDPRREAWTAADELERDLTSAQLAAALPEAATVVIVGWPDTVVEALQARGDVRALVVESGGDGAALAHALRRMGTDADDVADAAVAAAAVSADLVILEASAVGAAGAVCPLGSHAAGAVAVHAGVEVWLVAGVGRVLPSRLFDALVRRISVRPEEWCRSVDVVPLSLVSAVVGPTGRSSVEGSLRRADCPVAPELLRLPD